MGNKRILTNLHISPEAERLAVEFPRNASQAQRCLDLLAPSEDVYDLESTRKVLEFAAEQGICPERLAGFVRQLLERRGLLRAADWVTRYEIPEKRFRRRPPAQPRGISAIAAADASESWFGKWCRTFDKL